MCFAVDINYHIYISQSQPTVSGESLFKYNDIIEISNNRAFYCPVLKY